MMDPSLVIASVFMIDRHFSAGDSGPLDCAWDERISHTLVGVILSLLGMDLAPSSWDPQENDRSSGQRWQRVDPWWTDVCMGQWNVSSTPLGPRLLENKAHWILIWDHLKQETWEPRNSEMKACWFPSLLLLPQAISAWTGRVTWAAEQAATLPAGPASLTVLIVMRPNQWFPFPCPPQRCVALKGGNYLLSFIWSCYSARGLVHRDNI